MTFLVLIVFASALIFLLLSAVIYYSLSNLKSAPDTFDEHLKISIIVAAKNEAVNIPVLLESFKKLNYPTELFEIIIVNDKSSDETYNLAAGYQELIPNLIVTNTVKHETLTGKKAALTHGLTIAKYENIAITDADCKVPVNWLNELNKHLQLNEIVIGVAPLKQSTLFVNKIASFENLKAHLLGFALANIGLPYSAAARNFAFRKSILKIIGGYESVNETIGGDDDLLLREAVKHKMKIGIMTEEDSFVFSQTKSSFGEYFRQKARHASTSHHYLFRHKLFLWIWHVVNLICLFSFLLSFISSIFVLPIIIKLLVDYLIANSFKNKFGYNFTPLEIVLLNTIYESLVVVHFANSFRFKKRWN